MAQALQLRRRDHELSRAPAPTACAAPGCSPCSAPTSRRSPPARPARARRSCCGSPTRTWSRSPRRRSPAQLLARVEAISERQPRATSCSPRSAGPAAATTTLYPAALRDAADAPWALIGRGDPALLDGLEPDGVGDGRRRPPRQLLRPRGRPRAGPRAGRRPGSSWSAASPSASTPAPTGARSTPAAPIAVLGCGADVAYPAAHRSLWRRICERGLVLSELPPGAGAWRWTFPARNRIMAALAGMTVVVEAAAALRLADHRRPRRRPRPRPRRGARARSPRAPRPAPNNLLAGGACVVRDAQDVLDAMLGPGARRARARRAAARARAARGARGGRAGRGDLRRGRRRRSASPAPRPRPRSPGSSCSATSPARWSASTRERCCDRQCAASRLRDVTAQRIPAVLSIAGSDSGGGAGIQADLKAFARCGVHGMTAITAITAQNTVGVEAVEAVSPEMIVAQVRAVAEDIGVDAVKIGMLGTAATVDAVVEALGLRRRARPVVVDPVMVAESGAVLLDDEARAGAGRAAAAAGRGRHPEHPRGPRADRGGGGGLAGGAGPRGAGAGAGGGRRHRRPQRASWSTSSSTASELVEIAGERHPDGAAHGSGCTHSSALAAFLARGETPLRGRAQGPRGRLGGGRRRPARASAPGPARSTSSTSQPAATRRSVDFGHELQRHHRDQPSRAPAPAPSSTAPTAPTPAPT